MDSKDDLMLRNDLFLSVPPARGYSIPRHSVSLCSAIVASTKCAVSLWRMSTDSDAPPTSQPKLSAKS